MINNILLVRLRTSVTIRDLPCEKEIHRKHRIHGIEIRVYPCPPWKKNNPQMLNRFETDENPYNICLTSADKNHNLLIGKVVDRACLGRETDAYIVYLAPVGGVWQGVALFVYLFQSEFRSGVELELEDIDIVRTLQHAVDATLARLLFNVGVVFAEQLEDEVEGVLEMALTLPCVLLALEAIGRASCRERV